MIVLVKTTLIDIDENNEEKLQKHGLTIEQIKKFFQSNPSYRRDDVHSEDEERFMAFGPFEEGFMFVAFTYRLKGKKLYYRPISARMARAKEIRKLYESLKS